MKPCLLKNTKPLKVFLAGFLFMILMARCNNETGNHNPTSNATTRLSNTITDDIVPLPFIGIRRFETRAGVSGTGTPQWLVQIKKNRDVLFFFGQINQGDDSRPETTGKYYAGKFKKYIRCNFKEWDNFPRYYEITKDTVYEVDSLHKRLYLPDCCADGSNDNCACRGELWTLETDDSFVNGLSK